MTPSYLVTPRDWAAQALIRAADNLGTKEAQDDLIEARRYLACADEIARLESELTSLKLQIMDLANNKGTA